MSRYAEGFWRGAVERALALGDAAADGAAIGEDRIRDFKHTLVAAPRTAFPSVGAGTQMAVTAFEQMGQAFACAGTPERRAAFAVGLTGAAGAAPGGGGGGGIGSGAVGAGANGKVVITARTS